LEKITLKRSGGKFLIPKISTFTSRKKLRGSKIFIAVRSLIGVKLRRSDIEKRSDTKLLIRCRSCGAVEIF